MVETFIPALIVAFREGLEAFLVAAILLRFLDASDNRYLKKHVWHGVSSGVVVSFIFGVFLFWISAQLGNSDAIGKLWESIASFLAVTLVVTFIVWMIKHGGEIVKYIHTKAALNLSAKGIFLLTFFMLIREGVELAFFAFAGKYTLLPILLGIALSVVLVYLIHHSLINVKIKTLFSLTLIFLILQAGFLAGYSVHEGLSAAKTVGMIGEDHGILTKAFDLSATVLSHSDGVIGLPLSVILGWYSKPEIMQFIIHYGVVIGLFSYWKRKKNRVEHI